MKEFDIRINGELVKYVYAKDKKHIMRNIQIIPTRIKKGEVRFGFPEGLKED